MAGEDVSGTPLGGGSLEGWLEAKAEEMGVSREELLARLRPDADAAEASGEELVALRREFAERLAASHDDLQTEVEEARGEFDETVEEVREEFDEKIEDVRERVIQVKRETDGKAPADHDHPELAPAEAADRADELAAEVESLSEELAALDETVETGFDNYEDVLEYLTDATDDLESKLTTLAEATVDLREQTRTLAARHATRAAADELAHLANRRGVESAACGHCGKTVHIGLLAAPKCPHCASTFNDVEPKQGFFGSHTLVIGDAPALEGERADWDVENVMDEESADHDEALEELLEDDE
ncbi:hypothetical protein NGM10_10940 [Halorussus salilacus]|uniref:hypothetical protein n=1 Tax=Halorussus salilacus TaxID=2953750 RepID=UPI00209FE51D|nr:hypothetical protein [Halorussus salilacus]USZ67245.1 hypothetical protein NGM10_10940 [Halorussus salilacus]